MEATESQFLRTVLNSPDEVKKFLIESGNEGKSTAPISFFSDEDRDKFLRHSD